MKKLHLLGALLASTALVACGSGGDDTADTSSAAPDTAPAAVEQAADTPVEETTATDMMDDAASAMDDATSAMEEAAQDVEAAASDAADAAAAAVDDAAAAVSDAVDGGESGDAEAFTVGGLTGYAADGRRIWAQCMACHVLEKGVNRTGPSLYGIFGRTAGTVENFRYSSANAESGVVWTKETMFEYLENPREFIPGTIMAFPGVRNPQQRADLIAYIAENGGRGDQ